MFVIKDTKPGRITWVDFTLAEPIAPPVCDGCGIVDYDGHSIETFGAGIYCPPCYETKYEDARSGAYVEYWEAP